MSTTALLAKGLGLLIAPLIAYIAANALMGGYRGRKPPPLPRNKDEETNQ
jgi:hypothetical protein